MHLLFLIPLALTQLGASSPTAASYLPCHDFVFTVPTHALNDSGVIQTATIYSISATYCPPTAIVAHRATTVQLLLHGAVSNKHYWSALGPVGSSLQYHPYNYSYVDFARSEGYSTIAIDRLGAGNSSHPDPALVRTEIEAQITNTIIQQLRHSPFPFSPSKRIILVGHSFGSLVINAVLNEYPRAADAAIMTSYAHVFAQANSSVGEQVFAPARDVFPQRFGHLDPGYLTQSNESDYRGVFLGVDGSFTPPMPQILFDHQDVQADGEQASIYAELGGGFETTIASLYKGPVALMTGQQDMPFCAGDCGVGNTSLLVLSQPFFPAASNYSGFLIPDTGHLMQYHYSARSAFATLHIWLTGNGF
ncbi:hypothetical protein FIBSPDRAFT_847456 [Athelia psychrophila]|uniref:AB hydrolase-1 domain-containing protein n=1 Tax=Athelia psychrophila TaxID=1759441 RepID=A0A166WA81_9AGAM|nr:hypothetical protein FIBSPDRAFT_847456 [Fibularhizoctonia sp. CBS 109695]